MTNFEFWKDKILRICEKKDRIAIVNNKPAQCAETQCEECKFNTKICSVELTKWLYKEHVERPKLTKREIAFCELFEHGWIGRDSDGSLYWHESKPEKFYDRWVLGTGIPTIFNLKTLNLDFEFIKWEDSEPWSVEDLLKPEVKEDADNE